VDIASDNRLLNLDLLCLTETQLQSDYNVEHIRNSLASFNINFNSASNHRFDNIAICYKDCVTIESQILNAVSIITLRKATFSKKNISLAVIYRQQNIENELFLSTLNNMLDEHSIDILVGNFNIDALSNEQNIMLSMRDYYKLIVDRPTHLSGGLLDHVYIKKSLMYNKTFYTLIQNVFFPDHDAVCF